MARKTQLDKAIDNLEAERAVIDAAIAKLKQQKAEQTAAKGAE